MSSTFSNFFCRPTRHTSVCTLRCHSHNVPSKLGIRKTVAWTVILMCRHYLSSQAVASQVFSAQVSLTAVFGMGTGGPWNGYGWTLTAISTDYSIPQNLASMDKPTRCLSMETKKQRRERAFTLAWKRAIRSLLLSGDPYESRTRVCGVRGRRLNHLTNGPCRRSKLRIFRFHLAAKTPSLHCFSSSNQTRLRWALIGVLSVFGVPTWVHHTPKWEWYTFRDSNPGHPD